MFAVWRIRRERGCVYHINKFCDREKLNVFLCRAVPSDIGVSLVCSAIVSRVWRPEKSSLRHFSLIVKSFVRGTSIGPRRTKTSFKKIMICRKRSMLAIRRWL